MRKTGLVVEARKGGRKGKDQGPTELHFIDESEPVKSWEYAVLVCNWWSWYGRLAHPKTRLEAITSRPKLLECGGAHDQACRPAED